MKQQQLERSVDEQRTRSEVREILLMWSAIEDAYHQLSEDQRKQIELKAAPFGHTVRFIGFSANEEIEHCTAASDLINGLDRFDRFRGRELHSGVRCLDAYRRMLEVFKGISDTSPSRDLSVADMIDLLIARIHPDHREQ